MTIESSSGALVTVLEARDIQANVVAITQSGVSFGKPKKGFYLTGGLAGLGAINDASGVKVMGNLVVGAEGGFGLSGSSHTFQSNWAIGNTYGFAINGTLHQVKENFANTNLTGFELTGTGHRLTGNIASANHNHGFHLSGSGHLLSNNSAIANGNNGFVIATSTANGHALSNNAALGNVIFGFYVKSNATITKNLIYGNNSRVEPYSGQDFTNCGLLNLSGILITATNNFWGAPTGYGSDPADDGCIPSVGGRPLKLDPFVTKEFKIKTLTPLDELVL